MLGARVPQEPETNPNESGGPIRRGAGVLVPIDPVYNPPTMVYQTPHAVVPDAESGALYDEELFHLWTDKFLPDGRLVPANLGAAAWTPDAQQAARSLFTFTTLAGVFLGVWCGFAASLRGRGPNPWQRQVMYVGAGALLGGGSGVVTAGVLARTARLSAELVTTNK
jgi:hypothetical protein